MSAHPDPSAPLRWPATAVVGDDGGIKKAMLPDEGQPVLQGVELDFTDDAEPSQT